MPFLVRFLSLLLSCSVLQNARPQFCLILFSKENKTRTRSQELQTRSGILTSKSAPTMLCFFCEILASNGASRHSTVKFYISPPTRWLRTCRFGELTLWPDPKRIERTQYFATCLPFRATLIFFLLTLSSPTLSFSDFFSADFLFCDSFPSLTVHSSSAASVQCSIRGF